MIDDILNFMDPYWWLIIGAVKAVVIAVALLSTMTIVETPLLYASSRSPVIPEWKKVESPMIPITGLSLSPVLSIP